ncbi:MAG: NAD(P)/FAD-dependent oxidoreductase [Burkholderiaceae bacterium]
MADTMHVFDVVVIGAGAAGLFCAAQAGQRGLTVLLIDHAPKVAEKIRISGGGRANFTNRELDVRTPERHFISENPRFCRSALSRYTPQHFLTLMQHHGIGWHEKHKGQLFCDRSAEDLIAMLLAECAAGGVARWQPCSVQSVQRLDVKSPSCPHGMDVSSYEINSTHGTIHACNVVVATGGLSIPKIGATDFGQRLACQFGHRIVPLRPALVPLTFNEQDWAPFVPLAGLSLPVQIETGDGKTRGRFDEDLLFTHRGLSGPAVLQISSYWQEGTPIRINLCPTLPLAEVLRSGKARSRKLIANELSSALPSRLADIWTQRDAAWQRPINEASDKALNMLAESLQRWLITPSGSEGYKKAEVTAGGVDTRELNGQTMESHKSPGLYFIGEVVDVTGWLGGYNFQWAWASAYACSTALAVRKGK